MGSGSTEAQAKRYWSAGLAALAALLVPVLESRTPFISLGAGRADILAVILLLGTLATWKLRLSVGCSWLGIALFWTGLVVSYHLSVAWALLLVAPTTVVLVCLVTLRYGWEQGMLVTFGLMTMVGITDLLDEVRQPYRLLLEWSLYFLAALTLATWHTVPAGHGRIVLLAVALAGIMGAASLAEATLTPWKESVAVIVPLSMCGGLVILFSPLVASWVLRRKTRW